MAVNKLDITMMEDVGTSANQLLQRDGSGNIPAIDGSQIINIDPGFTVSTSDPAVDTNPSGGVGSLWYNKTDGEMYVCTDATAGANVWTNVGAGSGNVEPWAWQGETYGYTSGGYGGGYSNEIAKYSFTTDGNGTDVGDLTRTGDNISGTSSENYGYTAGGSNSNVIDKFPFASDTNASDVGDLLAGVSASGGAGSTTHGYISNTAYIQKWQYASDANATDVGDQTVPRALGANASSATYGYAVGGDEPPNLKNVIDRWPFASDANATDVGDLHTAQQAGACANSTTYAYEAGASITNKFSFASGTQNATSLGNLLTVARNSMTASSSTTYAYYTSGYASGDKNIIDKMSYSSEGNCTDVGDLPTTRRTPSGQQV